MNTLRSLAVDIMFNTGASKLLEVNSAVDEVKSNALEAAGNMDALGDSVEGAGKKADTFLGMSKSFMAITGAGVALGGALHKVTSRADELNEGLRRVEVQTGVSADEMREWIISVTDATSDVDGYVRSMEELVRMGVSTKEEFQEILPVFDTFGTATGKDMVEGIRDMHAVFSALGIEMLEAGKHIDTLTWLTTQTTVSMADLGKLSRREQAMLREMGFTFDEVAVAMAALEAEGIKGPRMVMRFQEALAASEGDMDTFWRSLGVGAEVLVEYNQKLLESEGLTEALAAANARSLTWWDHLKHRFDMLVWSAGSFLEPVKDLAPALMALGPISAGVSKGVTLMGKGLKVLRTGALIPAIASTWAFTTALLANPITWVVVGIGALIAAGILLWKNWDKVTAWLGEKWEWLKNIFGNLWNAAKDWGKNLIDGFVGGIKAKWNSAVDTVKDFAGDVAGKFKSFFGISSPSKLMMEYGEDITAGLQIGIEQDRTEIPTPEFPDFSKFDKDMGVLRGLIGKRESSESLVPLGGVTRAIQNLINSLPLTVEQKTIDLPTSFEIEQQPMEIQIPQFDDTPRQTSGNAGQINFNPQIEIRIEGDADGEDIRAALERYFPDLMDEFFELLAVRMG